MIEAGNKPLIGLSPLIVVVVVERPRKFGKDGQMCGCGPRPTWLQNYKFVTL